jgi:signal transduction histidine kinase
VPGPRWSYRERVTTRPPQAGRIRPGIWVALDCLLAAGCAGVTFAALFRPRGVYLLHVNGGYAGVGLPLLLAVWVSAPVAVRRRYPLAALVVVLAGCIATLAVGGEISSGAFLPLVLVLFVVAAACPGPLALAGLAGSLLTMTIQGVTLRTAGHGSGNALAAGLVLVVCWLAGYMARQRRAYAARSRQQVADAAVMQERLRIARELHDVVAHSLTVAAVQAGFAEYVFDTQPGQARSALAAIQTVTREALTDMQGMLAALRRSAPGDPGQAAALAPAAGLADLDRLVAGTAGAGVRVEVRQSGQARAIPAGVDLSAFRIVQESLTNVVKHSGADSCQVSIDYGQDVLAVEITDPGGPDSRAAVSPGADGQGHGIAGMAERVSLCGGDFTTTPLPGHGFRVAARFPLPGGNR